MTVAVPLTELTRRREIRVFVSSTFSDMHGERKVLAERVFPQLRRLCQQRGATWTEVDLRWGVTREEKDEGRLLPTILGEVSRCPFFIGILGERYGSIPERRDLPDDFLDRQNPTLTPAGDMGEGSAIVS